MSDSNQMSDPTPSHKEKGFASRLNPISQLMPVEELQEFIKTLRHRASLLVTFLVWIASGGASLFFFWQNEADWYAPMLIGWGLWLLWRIDYGGWIRFSFFSLYLIGDLLFLVDRAFPHFVWQNRGWKVTEFSLGLAICSGILALAFFVAILDMYKKLKKSRIYRKVMKRWVPIDTPHPSPLPHLVSRSKSTVPPSNPLPSSQHQSSPSKEDLPTLSTREQEGKDEV